MSGRPAVPCPPRPDPALPGPARPAPRTLRARPAAGPRSPERAHGRAAAAAGTGAGTTGERVAGARPAGARGPELALRPPRARRSPPLPAAPLRLCAPGAAGEPRETGGEKKGGEGRRRDLGCPPGPGVASPAHPACLRDREPPDTEPPRARRRAETSARHSGLAPQDTRAPGPRGLPTTPEGSTGTGHRTGQPRRNTGHLRGWRCAAAGRGHPRLAPARAPKAAGHVPLRLLPPTPAQRGLASTSPSPFLEVTPSRLSSEKNGVQELGTPPARRSPSWHLGYTRREGKLSPWIWGHIMPFPAALCTPSGPPPPKPALLPSSPHSGCPPLTRTQSSDASRATKAA